MPDDYTLGQFAAQDQPPWQAPPVRLAEWPGAERPSATNWMLGDTAALGDYIPPSNSNILGNIAEGVVDYAKRPGQTMAANPYPPGSEEAQFYEDQRKSNTYRLAPEAGLDLMGGGTPFAVRGGLGMAGGKIKTPAPGALAATDAYHPPFYSAVEQAVQGAKQNAAPGQQWAGFLRNQPGVKPEEVEALGLGKLFEQPGSVPKEAVLGEIAANRVNVGEKVLGDTGPKHVFGTPEQQAAALDRQERARAAVMNAQVRSPQWEAAVEEFRAAENAMRDIVPGWGRAPDTTPNPTKFSQYTLPGGENYREMLLTLPEKTTPSNWAVVQQGDGFAIRSANGEFGLTPDGRTIAKWPTREEAARAAKVDYAPEQPLGGEPFRSSHYDEPNILAHVRYNDRVIDGKKTLFVEEVQSDWHQKGKREGYASDAQSFEVLDNEGNIIARTKTREEAKLIADEEFDETSIRAVTGKTGVPDAPFKTTWPELAMKRIIREAAEKGYDKVAWTPGSVQAARYDLSKHVDGIQVSGRTDARTGEQSHGALVRMRNGRDLSVGYGKDGIIDNTGASNVDWKGKHLSDVFGKDVAEKMIEGKSIFDADLKIGGEGMKGFYDEILPATVNRLVKKHGGRVEQSQLAAGSVPSFSMEGHGPWVVRDQNGTMVRDFNNKEVAEAYLKQRIADAAKAATPTVHTIEITPQLRAQAMKGFPLFSAGGVAATGGIIGGLAAIDPGEAQAGVLGKVVKGATKGQWPTGFAPGSVLSPDYAVNKVVKYGGATPEVRTDPLHHGFSGLKTGKTTDEMAAEIVGAPNITRPLVKPEDLKGSELIFTPGDRGAGGGTMTSVGGTKLEKPVKLEAGADYPFLHGDKPIAGLPEGAQRLWANAPGQSTAMLNLGKEIQARGRQPVLMYQAMGKEAIDSSKQLALPAVDLAKQGSVSSKGVSFINKWMEGVEGFPGWNSPKLSEWLEQTSGTNRSRLMKGMDTRQARDAGFPDIGELRYTQTNPKLRSTPTGSVGLTVSKLDPSLGRVEQSLHTTYPTAVAGTEAGTLGGSIPWHVAAPDLHKNLMSLGKPTKFAERPDYYTTRMPEGLPKTQVVDQRWVDQVSEWMRKNPQLWTAPGGLAVMGGLASQDEYR